MAYIGKSPTAAPLTSSDITDGIISNAKLAQDIISADTALGAEPADTDELLVSDAGVLKRMDYSHIKGGGKVGQVVQTVKTNTFSTTSTSMVDITGFSVSITPSATSSEILVLVNVGIIANSNANGTFINLLRDSTNITSSSASGAADTNDSWNVVGGGGTTLDNRKYSSPNISYLDDPSSTSSLTYKCQIMVGGVSTGYVNQWGVNTDHASVSTITAIEVLA